MSGYSIKATFIGAEELKKRLEQGSQIAKQEVANALNKAGFDATSYVANPNNTPHKHGRLTGSFHLGNPGNASQLATPDNLTVKVGTNVEYARAQEYGTVGMTINVSNGRLLKSGTRTRPYTYIGNIKPKFYLRRTMEYVRPKMTEYMRQAAQRIVSQLAGK